MHGIFGSWDIWGFFMPISSQHLLALLIGDFGWRFDRCMYGVSNFYGVWVLAYASYFFYIFLILDMYFRLIIICTLYYLPPFLFLIVILYFSPHLSLTLYVSFCICSLVAPGNLFETTLPTFVFGSLLLMSMSILRIQCLCCPYRKLYKLPTRLRPRVSVQKKRNIPLVTNLPPTFICR
jgi:hypothetical protein